jgi:hypothetical protein
MKRSQSGSPATSPRTLRLGDGARTKARAWSTAASVVLGARQPAGIADPVVACAEARKVFVVGCPRSGTTWVARIFANQPEVVAGRESHLYPRLWRPIRDRGPRDIRTWARIFYGLERGRVLDRPAGLHHYIDRASLAALARPFVSTTLDRRAVAAGLVRGVLDAFFAREGGSPEHVLIEKTPLHVLYAKELLADFPEARIIEVRRDGRDACVSMQMRATREPAVPADRSAQARLWVQCIRAGLALQDDPAFRDRVTVVRYEDLKGDPSREIDRLYRAAGLESTPALVAEALGQTDLAKFALGAGGMHFRGEVGSWVEHFSDDDERVFREIAGDVFEAAGYRF